MKYLTATIYLTILVLLGNLEEGYAHDGTYELTLEGWLKETTDIKDRGVTKITAQCKKRENYNEVTFRRDDNLREMFFEFNKHKKHQTFVGDFSITIWGWINSFGIQTSNYNVFWHGKPRLYRWNSNHFKGSVVTKKLFMDIARQEGFQLYLENNPIRCPECPNITGMFKITNPDEIVNCFN